MVPENKEDLNVYRTFYETLTSLKTIKTKGLG